MKSSESTQTLVEDIALEIVVALLGVESPPSPPSTTVPTVGSG